MNKQKITCVIPARNEAKTIESVIAALIAIKVIDNIIVVDNNSSDATAAIATKAGAIVVKETKTGFGYALHAGFNMVEDGIIIKTDADIRNFNGMWILKMLNALDNDVAMVRAIFESDYDDFPVTNLAFRPLAKRLLPTLSNISTPLSGTYAVRVAAINLNKLPSTWAFDLGVLYQCSQKNMRIVDVDIGMLCDEPRSISYYKSMAQDIVDYLLEIGEMS